MKLPRTSFFRPFIEGTSHIFKTSCGVKVSLGKPYIKRASKSAASEPQVDEIAGIITVSSDLFNGRITLSFTEKDFLMIMEKMLGEKCQEITQDLESGAAELLNMIYGYAKVVLNQQGYSINEAIPQIVRGAELTQSPITPKTIVLPFKAELAEFTLEICAA